MHVEAQHHLPLAKREREDLPNTHTDYKKSKIQHPLPFDSELLIRCRLISSDVLNPKKLIFF